MNNDWNGKKVTILGLGRSGLSTAQYLTKRGAKVLLSDSGKPDTNSEKFKELQASGVEIETGGHSDKAIEQADLIVVSPGIPPTAPVIQKAEAHKKEVICDIELAFREAGTGVPIIGITGTNGKSTTCAMVSHVLETAGFSAPPCGNFGVPILSQLETKPNYLVAEVSSYQLHYCPTFAPVIGIWLNLTPDHLEWHGGIDNYIADKQKMFNHQRTHQFAVLNQDDPIVAAFQPPSQVFPFAVDKNLDSEVQGAYMDEDELCYRIDGTSAAVCAINELKIIGKHNLENALAAISVAALLRVDHDDIVRGVTSFKALEHRLEFAGTIDGVDFYNDSKATNPVSTIKALEAFGKRKIVLIAGGRDKGTPLEDMVAAIKEHVSEVILLGEAKDRFRSALEKGGFNNLHEVATMEEAVEKGRSLKKGPVVLSPACASFDMFKDYEERGRVFKDFVRARLEKMAPSH